jgi:hypothetical protein
MDDIRITKGFARYTNNFTPLMAEFPAKQLTNSAYDPYWNNVVLSMPMVSAIDNKGASATVNGPLTFSTIVKRFTSSGEFGSGKSITIPYDKSKYDWFSSDYTLEMWINPKSHSDSNYNINQVLCIGNMMTNTDGNYWSFGPNRNGKLCLFYWSGSINSIVGASTIPINSWTHIAMTHTGGKVRLFVNGVLDAQHVLSVTPMSGTEHPLTIGQTFDTGFDGYIEDIRITKGKARYTANFSVSNSLNPTLGAAS